MSENDHADVLQQRGLKLSHLRLLGALFETGQVSVAATSIGITQPAASRLLAEIERIIGRPVHERTGRGMVLTDVGKTLAVRAQRIQMELRDAARDMSEITAGTVGQVRIGSVTGPALDRVLPALRIARVAHPNVTAEVIVATSDILCQQLLTGKLDFVIGRRPLDQDRDLLDETIIAEEPVALVTRRTHPLTRLEAITPADLLLHDWVMPGRESLLGKAVLHRLRSLGLSEPQQRLSTASFLLTLALLQQSNAIAPLARAVAESFTRAADAPYVKLPIDLGIIVEPFALLTRSNGRLPAVAQRLADLILAIRPEGTELPAHHEAKAR